MKSNKLIKKFSKKSYTKTIRHKNNKQLGGAAKHPNSNKTLNFVSEEDLYQDIVKDIHFGKNPFANPKVIILNIYNKEKNKYENKEFPSESFNKWIQKEKNKDKFFILFRTACLKGNENAIESLLNLFYPNYSIPDIELYKIYLLSIYWEYDRTGNPVRHYLDKNYADRLKVKITEDLLTKIDGFSDGIKKQIEDEVLFSLFKKNISMEENNWHSGRYGRERSSGKERSSGYGNSSKKKENRNDGLYMDLENLKKQSTYKDLQKTYRALALKYHPDKHLENKDKYHEALIQINKVFDERNKEIEKNYNQKK